MFVQNCDMTLLSVVYSMSDDEECRNQKFVNMFVQNCDMTLLSVVYSMSDDEECRNQKFVFTRFKNNEWATRPLLLLLLPLRTTHMRRH